MNKTSITSFANALQVTPEGNKRLEPQKVLRELAARPGDVVMYAKKTLVNLDT